MMNKINQKVIRMMNKKNFFDHRRFKKWIFFCDLNIKNKKGKTPLMYLLEFNQSKKIRLSAKTIYSLIKRCNLHIEDNNGQNIFLYLFLCNEEEKILLNQKQLKKIFLRYSEQKKQEIFQKIIEEKAYFSSYEKDFYFFIQECNLNISEKNIQWLYEKKHHEILDILKIKNIEKMRKNLYHHLLTSENYQERKKL